LKKGDAQMRCRRCGFEIQSNSQYCNNCGITVSNLQYGGYGSINVKNTPQKDNSKRIILIVSIAVVIALIVGALGAYLFLDKSPSKSRRNRDNDDGENTTSAQGVAAGDFSDSTVGDIISFGTYEQDNNTSNGKEAIEWIVLYDEGDRKLVISKYALDSLSFSTYSNSYTWDVSSIRQWLNNDFINASFSDAEKNMIATSYVIADSNPEYDTYTGEDTHDKVFLLSADEADEYFDSDSQRVCQPTVYTTEKGVDMIGEYCFWWLRTPGDYEAYICCVDSDGNVDCSGSLAVGSYTAVRPAMWINVK